MAITRGSVVSTSVDTSTPIFLTVDHTVEAGTTLLIVTYHCEGDLSVAVPDWDEVENLTLITSVTTSSAGGDSRVYVYGRVNPSVKTSTITVPTTGAGDNIAVVAINYMGTIQSSVADATNVINTQDNGNNAATTVALSGSTTAGSTLLVAGTFYGGDGNPSSETTAGFSTVSEGETGTSATTDSSYYVGDKIGGGTGGTVSPTIDWTGTVSDECVGVFIEILPDPNQTLTQTSRFTNSNSLAYSHTLTLYLTPSLFTNSNSLAYSHILAPVLTPDLFTNSNSLAYEHSISAPINLSQSSRYDNSQSFYTHALALNLTPDLFSNSNSLSYEHTITQGLALAPDLFENSQSFYAHALALNLTPDLFSNSNSLAYQHDVGVEQTLTASLASNSQSFFSHTLSTTVSLTPSLFSNTNSLAYQHQINLALSASLFSNSNSLAYSHTVDQFSILSPPFFQNDNSFFTQVLRNQYPDPSTVLIGVQYGEPGLEFTGTNVGEFDSSLKLDVSSGRMVKLLTNKVALTL